MNAFLRNEQIGRSKFESLLQQLGIETYHFTEETYAPIDAQFTYNEQCYIAEIKVRKMAYSTLFMEKTKLVNMIKIIKSGQAQNGYYVNFVGDKVYLFSISKVCDYLKEQKAYGNRMFYKRLLPQTTSGNSEKIWKAITELPLSLATCLTFKDGKYVKE